MKKKTIIIYPEDFKKDHVWQDICGILDVTPSGTEGVKIVVKSAGISK